MQRIKNLFKLRCPEYDTKKIYDGPRAVWSFLFVAIIFRPERLYPLESHLWVKKNCLQIICFKEEYFLPNKCVQKKKKKKNNPKI